MKRLPGIILWTVLFFAIFLGIDQLLLRVPFQVGGLREIRHFYVDFRARLFSQGIPPLVQTPKREEVVERGAKPVEKDRKVAEKKAETVGKGLPAIPADPRFVYADEEGSLQFVQSLDEIPARFRREAKALDR